ncbi:metallophosphoesterase family protein [Flavobacterium psychrophilum]|uniref:metallophosphoesterase family protein n=1 Tax=Flavobacterium psychrophilum TaxID=96345 RepID=UPI000743A012|nr:metallophosphoesterase family protein [Flavobacterium psychrophilum]EKT3974842.1 serine/threonine protein phosphatase [Flavobacterium psychrophilum]EKT4537521.1 serine/threonine protein phosphatase [Flavobacterium psychrophilum]EKT4548154.1 serine/threonine protein phosphatase [Flavobacterium psychrophilum]EKT4571699.1 serine/threonine protein phosphatase [Flavobacterium psychrophilum]KUM18996.1 metallophosphatase [Flavobacterium psychrophilum]
MTKITNRTLVIGDIHGGLKALIQVLDRAKVTKTDVLIFLGDYVDGWSESPQVLDFLISLQETNHCVFLRGNHDELLLDWLARKTENINLELWYKSGGKATVLAYQTVSERKKQKHILFLKSLQNYYLDSDNRLFVHAGFTNANGVHHEYFPKILYWDRTLWETALALNEGLETTHKYYPKRFVLYKEIYIGHTAVTKIEETTPINKANIWNIDTGAAFLGPLTIFDINTKQFWQSDHLPCLYSNEKGRN